MPTTTALSDSPADSPTAAPRITGRYGEAPVRLGHIDLSSTWLEFMHYLYLPVRIPATDHGLLTGADSDSACVDERPASRAAAFALPRRLAFLGPAIATAVADAARTAPHLSDPYVYVTARRGHASPGNPLNRPGWHCDDFGGDDLNYIWTDRFPTRFLVSDAALAVPSHDQESMAVMERLAAHAQALTDHWHQRRQFNGNAPRPAMLIEHGPSNSLLRLSPYVIHATPTVPDPGGLRSFFKISVSTHRYDLIGNSHNYDLDYDWPMVDRAAVRNQPASATVTDSGADLGAAHANVTNTAQEA